LTLKRNPRALRFRKAAQAFCKRKYLSGFSREMSRSAKLYLQDFEGFDPEA
jgi:hypothetical protein